jgi:SAM-dependent methyltransferase
VVPPSSRAPRQAASMAPPRPPHTTTAPRRASSRPTDSAASTSSGSARPGPITDTYGADPLTDATLVGYGRNVDAESYRRTSLETWEGMAAGWDRWRDWVWEASRRVGEDLVERSAPGPGETVLELAAGAGDTGFMAAQRIGSEGRLICTDFAPKMVELARKRAGEAGVGNAEFRVMDAERMGLPDGSVDVVLCRWAYMLMADPAAALVETRRVLRGGSGRAAFSVWAGPERNPWASVPGRVMVEAGHMPAPEPGTPGIFAMADPERTRQLATQAGFGEVEIAEVELSWRFESFDDYWTFVNELAGALAVVIAGLSEEDRQAVRGRTEEALGGDLDLAGVCLNTLAR